MEKFKKWLLERDYKYYSTLKDWERERYFSLSDNDKFKELLFYFIIKPFKRV